MGAKDIKRQKPNCDAMRKMVQIIPVYSGSQTLVDAVSECRVLGIKLRYYICALEAQLVQIYL